MDIRLDKRTAIVTGEAQALWRKILACLVPMCDRGAP